MSDLDDWDFAGADDAKANIRAAIRYLLKGSTGGARGDLYRKLLRSCARSRASREGATRHNVRWP
jgi:hypothetical protein